MLKEVRNVRQESLEGHRRWFDDDMLPIELIVWYDSVDAIEGFQLCYNLGGGEHALTWRPQSGFAHSEVDSGSDGPFANRTPILTADGMVPWEELTQRFDGVSASLDPALRTLVTEHLKARH